jgi:hypothetical protein
MWTEGQGSGTPPDSPSSKVTKLVDGAKQALGSSTVVKYVSQRNWRKTLRPLDKFLSPTHFGYPATATEAKARTFRNLQYFQSNYVAFSCLLSVFSILSSPTLLLVLFGLIGLWHYLNSRDKIFLPAGLILEKEAKFMLGAVITSILVFMFAGSTLFLIIGISTSCTGLHAVSNKAITEEEAEVALERDSELAGLIANDDSLDDPELGGAKQFKGEMPSVKPAQETVSASAEENLM